MVRANDGVSLWVVRLLGGFIVTMVSFLVFLLLYNLIFAGVASLFSDCFSCIAAVALSTSCLSVV